MTATAVTPLLDVRHLTKTFPSPAGGWRRRHAPVHAVRDVSFTLGRGEVLGLVGESGCGKTTTARCVLRAYRPTSGAVRFQRATGEVVDLAALPETALKPLRREMQMIFQDPFASLNPRMTVGEIVGEPLAIHGLARGRERADRVAAMLRRVGLKPEHRHRYPHAFSGGQRQRIGIARALILHPALVIADEAVSALDVSVQAQVINLLDELRREFELAYLFVAHDLRVVRHLCDRVAVMYAGRLVELAPTAALFETPRHPYSRALLAAVPSPDPDLRMTFKLTGEPANPMDLPPGCPFHPRCPLADARCRAECPTDRPLSVDRRVACHHAT